LNNAPLKYRITRGRSEYEKLSKLLVAYFFILSLENIQIHLKNFIFTYKIPDHGSKTSAADFDPLAFGTILTQHVVPVPTG